MIKLASALKASNVDLFNKIREALNNNQSERMVFFTPAELQRAADWYNKEEYNLNTHQDMHFKQLYNSAEWQTIINIINFPARDQSGLLKTDIQRTEREQ